MPNRFRLRYAAERIAAGGVVAHPTEGVFGLACDPDDREAILRILALKRRDPGLGLILIGSVWDQLAPYCAPLDDDVVRRMHEEWPGPVTFIVPAAQGLDLLGAEVHRPQRPLVAVG